MSKRGFQSVFMVGAVASAALGCYLVSLRVASERASLEGVETKIVLAQRDIRLLETEIGTRGRLAQLERWNASAIQLSAPTADQFVETGFQLATLAKPEAKPAVEVPVVLASVPAPQAPSPTSRATSDLDDGAPTQVAAAPSRSASDMMHVASYERPQPRVAAPPKPPTANPVQKLKAAAGVLPATKIVKTALADPLFPLPGTVRKAKSGAAGMATPAKPAAKPRSATTKDHGTP